MSISSPKPARSTTFPPLNTPHEQQTLHILIVGAGIGGVMLGLLLAHASISFTILERSSEIRPMGSAISLGPNVLRLFEQLDLYKEVAAKSKPVRQIDHYDDMNSAMDEPSGVADMMFTKHRYGYANRCIPRSDLYHILHSKIPSSNIHMNKYVIDTFETNTDSAHGYITVQCKDGSLYRGSIVVGADGSYSTIKGQMYTRLHAVGKLSMEEQATHGPYQHCVVGVTNALDPKEFPALANEFCDFQILRGRDQSHSFWIMPLTGNRIAWNVFCRFPKTVVRDYNQILSKAVINNPDPALTEADRENLRRNAWRELSNMATKLGDDMQLQLRSVKNPLSVFGGTIGYLFDNTRPEYVSKATIEQGISSIWYDSRTVLLGDSCHKSLPYGGQGANQAILDAVFLVQKLRRIAQPHLDALAISSRQHLSASFLTSAPQSSKQARWRWRATKSASLTKSPSTLSPSSKLAILPLATTRTDFEEIFQDYYEQRSDVASVAMSGSYIYDLVFGGDSLGSRVFRKIYFHFAPMNIVYFFSDPFYRIRPVLNWMKSTRSRGSCIAAEYE